VKSPSRGWQPRVAVMVEEEEGSSNIGCDCAVTSWLKVASVVARVRLQYEDDGQRCTQLLRRRAVALWSERWLLLCSICC
ncbi:hypothetical protein BHM03_00058554, partial [Ensete ventricosum]